MSGLRFDDISGINGRLLAITGLEHDEFDDLLAHFDVAFTQQMQHKTIHGDERQGRAYANYDNCPLPTIPDKLLFVLVFLKNNLSQEMMATLFDLPQNRVHHWLYTLLPALRAALIHSHDLPARTNEHLQKHLNDNNGPLFVTTV